MKQYIKIFLLALSLSLLSAVSFAQDITSVHGIVSDDFGPLMGATVCEIDGNGRIIESAVTDMNGNFTMKVRNASAHKIRFSYVGLDTQTLKIDKTTYDIKMESKTVLQEVTVKSKKRMNGNSLPIPEREVSFAMQSISTKEFEGLGINTIDEALQGRIAGLDIVSGGNLGSGSTMRLRGGGSLSGLTNENPLIVVDGNVRNVDMSSFDLASANEEKFAELLNVNTEDIASINVLKDAAATAIYGSQGGNGVIELTTKRGSRGKPKVSYSGKLTATYLFVPKSMELLNGDDYTMLLKESYFNPQQSDSYTSKGSANYVPEINYDPTFSEYNQYNDNTDWTDAVTQWGLRQNHYLTISGGGEKATFRISGGYDHETGTIIQQKLNRFSTRVNLDYNISERIRVQTNFAMTYTKNNRNYEDLLPIARKKMPNMSIYEEDDNGNDTDVYYNMLQSGSAMGSEIFKNDQRNYSNPVAVANLAKNIQTTYDVNPELVLNYELLGMDEDHHRLTWRGQVYMNVWNEYVDKFFPADLVTTKWTARNHNTSHSYSKKSVSLTTKHTLTFIPSFKNKDHSAMMMGRMEYTTGSYNDQATDGEGLPSGGIESPYAGGVVRGLTSGYGEWRNMYFTFSAHYAYKSRYMADFSMRADGTTKFGPDKRWGVFPSVSLRWNVIDEKFMESIKGNWLSMLSIRPSWGMTGKAPNRDYLYTSKYASTSKYMDMAAMFPTNLRLTDLRWEKVSQYNLGFDLGFWNDKIQLTFEMYNMTTTDNLMPNYRIPSNTGFYTIAYYNSGKKRDTGWEFRLNTNKLIKKGKFSMDMNVNFGNNRSEVLEMDKTILKATNTIFNNENRQPLTRLELNNAFGSIYGFRYKGVYTNTYGYLERKRDEMGWTTSEADVAAYKQWIMDEMAANKKFPIALNENGEPIMDAEKGEPIRMKFNATTDESGKNYSFNGGDAIYEDINHDGQINSLDIVYLGSSLPKINGGFGFTFNYGDWRLSTQFSYRVGNKILNMARLDSESMITNDNQTQAVNYRWRKEGDGSNGEAIIPRAMYGNTSNYNTLISDRFVESGTYLRMTYAQLSYTIKKKYLKGTGLSRIALYFSANNPFVLTKYTGMDPDISYGGYAPAQDGARTPRSRSYTFGLTVDF